VIDPQAEFGTDPGAGPGTLFVVATPIGNLRDVTLRALEVLAAVPLIAAEDTRLTHRLLARHGITTRTVSYHARSGSGRLVELLRHLRAGFDLALVTDAGTPVVSDPGDDLVREWATQGGRVVPIPGPSAVLAAVAASGVAGPRWGFEGFLPRSGRERRERLARIAADDRATVLFEAPTRLAGTLADLGASCGPSRRAAVCRELTKLHEQIVRGDLDSLTRAVASGEIPARGEVTIVVAGRAAVVDGAAEGSVGSEAAFAAMLQGAAPGAAPLGAATLAEAALAAARAEVDRLAGTGLARGDAARQVSASTGIPRRQLYRGSPRG
jgi:16S rRNA (cytidine1402-2'-O)-methyltransferase